MRIRVTLSIGLAGCRQEDVLDVNDSELEGMSENERQAYLNEVYAEWRNEYLDGGWEEC
jgi:hypothetical protein